DALGQANALTPAANEETSTGAVAPISTPGAFARQGDMTNRATLQSQREGWQLIDTNSQRWPEPSKTWWKGRYPVGHPSASLAEASERDQTGRKKAHKYPFGEDPLGQRERHHGRIAWERISEASGSNDASRSVAEGQTSETLTYLADMLPCDSAEVEGN